MSGLSHISPVSPPLAYVCQGLICVGASPRRRAALRSSEFVPSRLTHVVIHLQLTRTPSLTRPRGSAAAAIGPSGASRGRQASCWHQVRTLPNPTLNLTITLTYRLQHRSDHFWALLPSAGPLKQLLIMMLQMFVAGQSELIYDVRTCLPCATFQHDLMSMDSRRACGRGQLIRRLRRRVGRPQQRDSQHSAEDGDQLQAGRRRQCALETPRCGMHLHVHCPITLPTYVDLDVIYHAT